MWVPRGVPVGHGHGQVIRAYMLISRAVLGDRYMLDLVPSYLFQDYYYKISGRRYVPPTKLPLASAPKLNPTGGARAKRAWTGVLC